MPGIRRPDDLTVVTAAVDRAGGTPGVAEAAAPAPPTVPPGGRPTAPRPVGPPPQRPPARTSTPAPRGRSLGAALGIVAVSTVAPGSGHLILGHRRTGAAILGVFVLVVVGGVVAVATMARTTLISTALSTSTLAAFALLVLAGAIAWIVVIVRTWVLARPLRLGAGPKIVGTVAVVSLCLVVAAPFGFAANLANSQRNLLNTLFRGGGTAADVAFAKPRLNVLLIGSDAGPDRTGTRTDTMMVASVDTKTASTILFGLPRNIQRAQFPPGSAMAAKFPRGFHDPADPLSGNYLLNAVYAYAHEYPDVAPRGPSADPGINLLMSSVTYMLGLPLDYYLEVDMEGFSALIDALGGVRVDVGPVPLPIGGVLPDGRHVRPDGYIQPGVQQLDGDQALWFARSRRDSSDYDRMGRQRCLMQAVLDQKSPASLVTNFQDVATAATQNIHTDVPQELLPELVALLGDHSLQMSSVTFDPSLTDPNERDGRFSPGSPDPAFMSEVVKAAVAGRPLASATTATTPTTTSRSGASRTGPAPAEPTTPPPATAPVSLAASCAPVPAN